MKRRRKPTISFKVKVRPEDFQVVEVADLVPEGGGEYRLYRLTKSGWNTTDLLLRLAKRFGLRYQAISYGGKKDRHALTEQYITIRDRRNFSLQEETYRLESLGFVTQPMTPERIRGNRFLITLRAIREPDVLFLKRNLHAIRARGVPNYFDDQRFGSYDKERGFIAEKLLKDQWEEGLKIYLTLEYPEQTRATRKRKHFFRDHWWQWEQCRERARTVTEQMIFDYLVRRGGNYVGAMNLVPREELSLILAAYQSYLWNEMVAEMITHLASRTLSLPGVANTYVFYIELPDDAFDYLRALRLPTPGPKVSFPDPYTERIFTTTLERVGVHPSAFALKKLYRAYFTSFSRDVLVMPEELELLDVAPDDLYPGRVKATVRFFLPRGAYGTMVLKRLTLKVKYSPANRTASAPGSPSH